jgi:hypothetical protein
MEPAVQARILNPFDDELPDNRPIDTLIGLRENSGAFRLRCGCNVVPAVSESQPSFSLGVVRREVHRRLVVHQPQPYAIQPPDSP